MPGMPRAQADAEEEEHEQDEQQPDEEWQHMQEQLRQALENGEMPELAQLLVQAATQGNDDDDDEAEWEDVSGGKLVAVFQCCESGDDKALAELLEELTAGGAGGAGGAGAGAEDPLAAAGTAEGDSPSAEGQEGGQEAAAGAGGAGAASERDAAGASAPAFDINAPGPDGDTALNLACLYGHQGCVEVLLKCGADPSIVNQQDGSTVLHDAAAGGYLEICQLILGKAPQLIKIADEDGDTPLHNAARGNHMEVVQLLLEAGADPSSKNGDGNTPAQEADEEPVVELLQKAVAAV